MHSLAMMLAQSALVLKEFTVNHEGPEYVHIVARKAGIIAFLLTLLGVDTTTTFRVYADHIEFEEGSLSGRINSTLPLRSVSAATCGFTKPFVYLILAFIFLITTFLSLGCTAWICLILLAITVFFAVLYYLGKALLISVITHSGVSATVCFKRSIIEGVSIDYSQAQNVIQLINELMFAQASK